MVWYGGFVALAMKAYKLFAEAYRPEFDGVL